MLKAAPVMVWHATIAAGVSAIDLLIALQLVSLNVDVAAKAPAIGIYCCHRPRRPEDGAIPVAQVLFENQGRASKNKAVDLEDMKFHQCVRLTRFENDRTISFIPPDGAFDLMCALFVNTRSAQSMHRSLDSCWASLVFILYSWQLLLVLIRLQSSVSLDTCPRWPL